MQAPEIGAARIREDFRNLQNANFWHVRFCAACAVEWNISPWLGFEVDYQFELRRLLDRQVNGPFALEYPPHIDPYPDTRPQACCHRPSDPRLQRIRAGSKSPVCGDGQPARRVGRAGLRRTGRMRLG